MAKSPQVLRLEGEAMSKNKKIAERQLQARYDAAQTTAENQKHWSFADSLSADAANSPAVRKTLRSRSRYEVANNSYAKGIVSFIANDVLGTKIRLQMTGLEERPQSPGLEYRKNPISKDTARFIEGEFFAWMQATKFHQKLITARKAKCVDGESFLEEGSNPRLEVPVKLTFHCHESEMIANPYDMLMNERNIDGIIFDQYGNPTTYKKLKQHPGALFNFLLPYETVDVAANRMIHLFSADRPGQHRGIPEIMPALPLFAQLRRMTLAVIAAAETAADIAGILKTMTAPEDPEYSEGFERIEIERRALLTLPEGYELQQFKPEQPSTTYADFKQEILAEIVRCLSVPLNVAKGDSSKHNYASARLDWQLWHKTRSVDRAYIESVVLDHAFREWLKEAQLIEGYLPQEARSVSADFSHQWLFDGDEHVDPNKEASAQAQRLKNLTATLADEWGKKGADWEEKLQQIARERQLMATLGLGLEESNSNTQAVQDQEAAEAGFMIQRDENGNILGITTQ